VAPNDKRDLYKGLDDGWSRAMEFALTPLLTGFLGYLLDSWAGTLPVFTIVFVIVTAAGMLVKTFYAYDAAMRAQEAASPWGRKSPGSGTERT
jgi:F0F1-type ATP synthase assembly protein I